MPSTGTRDHNVRDHNVLADDPGTELCNVKNISYRVCEYVDHPGILQDVIERWARIPPNQFVRIIGRKTQHWVDDYGHEKSGRVTEFDIRVPFTEYLLTHPGRPIWARLRIVENGQKAYRGTTFKQRQLKPKHINDQGFNGELPELGLEDWCQLYCANQAKLKKFLLTREVTNLDEEYLKSEIRLRLQYHGKVDIRFPIENAGVMLHSDHFLQRLQYKMGFMTICNLTMISVFLYPIIWLFTKKYDVVKAEWPFARVDADGRRRFTTVSEEQWINRWTRAIQVAVNRKRTCTLNEEDLIRYP
jgi:hypothetical protein